MNPTSPAQRDSARIRSRTLIAAALFASIVVALSWFGEANKQKVAVHVAEVVAAARGEKQVAEFRDAVADLQRHVLLYRLTGNDAITRRTSRLYRAMQDQQIDMREAFADDRRREILDRILPHIDAYNENFGILVENRKRIDRLANTDLPSDLDRFNELLERTALEGSGASITEQVLLLRQTIDWLADAVHLVMLDPYTNSQLDVASRLAVARSTIHVFGAGNPGRRDEMNELLSSYASRFALLVQLIRGDLQLTNVVMAGSADEILRLTEELTALTTAQIEAGRISAESAIRNVRRNDLALLGIATVFSLALILLIYRSNARLARAETELLLSERRFRATFHQAAVGIAHVSPDGRFIRVNQRLCEIVGYPAEELVEKTFQDITHPDDLDEDLDQVQKVLDGEIPNYSMEKRYYHSSGRIVWINLTASLIRDEQGNPQHFISVIEDIGRRKRAERQLQRSRTALARSNADLQRFAYVASHDLQEPLRMVTSYLELLKRRYEGKLGDDADEFIGFAIDGAARMRSLIRDLLALSRVDSHAQELGPVDLHMPLFQALENLQVSLRETGGTVDNDPLPTVRGDWGQLVQLLQNLIGNAIRYRSDQPPKIHLSATRVAADVNEDEEKPQTSNWWQISVRDNGIGIAPEHAQEIFEIFRRLDARDQSDGTGIGLALCKRIVERHGGRIWVEPNEEHGSVFCFTLRAASQ